MQVNFNEGKILSYSLYDDGVVLKRGTPAFKKYAGKVDGISVGDTVEQVGEAWGQPTDSYAHGQADTEQTIVLSYKDRASLTVWPLKNIIGRDGKTVNLPTSDAVNAQRIQSITLFAPPAEKKSETPPNNQ